MKKWGRHGLKVKFIREGRIEADHMKIRKFASQLWLAVNNRVVEVKRWNFQGGKMVENVRSWRSFVSIRLLVKKLCCTKKKTWSRYVEFWNGTWKPSLSYFACVIILYSLTNYSVSHQRAEIKIVMISFSFGREPPMWQNSDSDSWFMSTATPCWKHQFSSDPWS